jgi:type III secretion system FlhB-like substrate exporter
VDAFREKVGSNSPGCAHEAFAKTIIQQAQLRQLFIAEEKQICQYISHYRIRSDSPGCVYKAFVKTIMGLMQLVKSFAAATEECQNEVDSSSPDCMVDELAQLAQSLVTEADQIEKQAKQFEKQAFDRMKDLKENIECNRNKLEFMKKFLKLSEEDNFDELSKLIPIIAETEDEDLKNCCMKCLQGKQNEYIFTVVFQTFRIAAAIFLSSFLCTALCLLTLESGSDLPMIIAASVAGGLTVLSAIIACFAACTSAHVSMLKNLGDALKEQNSDVLKEQNYALEVEERDDLKLREVNDSLSESYPLSEISETSDQCVP